MSETFTYAERTYEWCGGFGAMFKSFERGVQAGDVRMFDGRLFYAFQVKPRGWFMRPEVWWTLPKPTSDDVRACKARMFRVDYITAGARPTQETPE